MKYSIRRQITAIFIALLAFILGGVLLINSGFLVTYYLSHKTEELVRTYNDIDRTMQTGSVTSVLNTILVRTERGNIDLVVLDSSGKAQISTMSQDDLRYNQMIGEILVRDIDSEDVLRRDNSFIVYRSKTQGISGSDVEYLKMRGTFSDGSWFIMQSPLASIRESASLANRFLIYLGGVGIILGGVLIWLFSRRITQPVMQLARLSQEMANLNFDARYTGSGRDEIGVLGSNFNKMSEQLEKTKIEEMRNEFLGNVSHELKTPIALIQGYAEGLKEGINDDPESREFYCDVIMDEADKMNHMVKNLLTLNQLEFGADEVQFERFDIVGLVRGVIASCEILIQRG